VRDLHSHGRRQAVAHRAEPPEVIQRFGFSKPKYCAAHI
jgi:hypothetical protein